MTLVCHSNSLESEAKQMVQPVMAECVLQLHKLYSDAVTTKHCICNKNKMKCSENAIKEWFVVLNHAI